MEETNKFKLVRKYSEEDLSPDNCIQYYNRRFATAIDISLCIDWVENGQKNLVKEFENHYKENIVIEPPTVDTITHFLTDCLSPFEHQSIEFQLVSTALNLAQYVINLQIDWINSRNSTNLKIQHQTLSIPLMIKSYCESLILQGFRLDSHMLKLQRLLAEGKQLNKDQYQLTIPTGTMYLFGKFTILKWTLTGKYILLPSCIIPLVVAKSIELGSCLLYLSQVRRSDRIPYISTMLHLLDWMRNILRKHGNTGHSLLKALDGIGHGILTEVADDSHSSYLLDNMVKELINSGFSSYEINEVVSIFRKAVVFDIPNMIGLAKIFGHPTIETSLGMKKLYDRTHKEILIGDDAIDRVINMAKLLFLAHYWKKHRMYPRLLISSKVPRDLTRALLSNRSFTSPEFTQMSGKVNPVDFSGITLLPCIHFDWYDRFYPLLKDKAAAPRKHRIQTAMNEKDSLFPGSARVLLAYLNAQNLSGEWKSFRRMFCMNPLAVDDEFVIKLTSKEKEQKVEGRMFGQSPILERQRRIVGEMNVSMLMELYNTDQAMLINEHEKRKRMAFLSRASYYTQDSFTIIIGVDAEAWNNYFRAPLVNEFGRQFFDRIFGVKFYEHTMDVFQRSFIYHRDAADNIIYWEGQQGGIEGLAQKIWTWIYTVIARLVLHMTGLEGYMMVNGDDMRIILIVPKQLVDNDETKLREYQNSLLINLRDLFRLYGIFVKVDETNMTRSLLCFGKQYVLKGMSLPAEIKKIIKASGLTDVGFPSISDIIGSISSNTHSACGVSYQTIPNVTFAYTMILLYLHWHKFVTLRSQQNVNRPLLRHDDAAMILTIPNVLGGLDTMLLYQYILQGESDPLPLVLDWLTYLWHNRPETQHSIRRVLSIPLATTLPRELLIVDIYALPLERPPRPLALVRNGVRKYLNKSTRNAELRKLLDYDRDERSRIVNAIWAMTPYNSRIASYLYSLSPCALVDSIIQKFDSAPTLSSLIFRRDRKRNSKLYHMVINADRKLIGTTITRVCGGSPTYQSGLTFMIPLIQQKVCATNQAIYLREKAWRKFDMIDSTIPSVLQQLAITEINSLDPSLQTFSATTPQLDHFTLVCGKLTQTPVLYGPLSKLMSAPYFYHTTGLRLGARLTDLKGHEPLIVMIRKLTDAQALLSDQGGDVAAWASWCSISLFGEDLNKVCPSVVKKLGGTIGHRLPSWGFERTIYLNTLPSRTGRCKSNLDTTCAKDGLFGRNRTHNYSAMTCWLQYHGTADLENDLLSSGHDDIYWGVMIACRDQSGDPSLCRCHEEVKNHQYEMPYPSDNMLNRLERLINGCELTKLSEDGLDMLVEYRKKFHDLWYGAVDYQTWLSSVPTEEKYYIASYTASLIICSELQPSSAIYTANTHSDDLLMFNTIIGRSKELQGISVRDLIPINMQHLAQALISTCIGYLIDSFSIIHQPITNNWIRSILPPGMFFPLCQSLFITKSHGRFLLAINDLAESVHCRGIAMTYDVLISPTLIARSISQVMVNLSYCYLTCGTIAPVSHLMYVPGNETEDNRRKIFLNYIWRILILSVIKGNIHHQIYPPSKHMTIDDSFHDNHVPYITLCAMMTSIYNMIGSELCQDQFRQIIITKQDWTSHLLSSIMTWDPLHPTIDLNMFPSMFQHKVDNLIKTIIESSYLESTIFTITITRIPFKVCIEACKEWIQLNLGYLQGPTTSVQHRVYDIEPPLEAISTPALPMDSDLHLCDIAYSIDIPQTPVPYDERLIWDSASLNRYYMLSTSALNKYIECFLTIKNLQSLLKHNVSMLATADGSGGVTVLLARLFQNATIYFNTLEDEPMRRASLIDCPDTAYLRMEEALRIRSNHNASGFNDLSQHETIKRLKLISEAEHTKFWCITCDMEAKKIDNSTTDTSVLNNLIRLFEDTVSLGGLVIYKRFITTSEAQLKLYLYMVSTFSHVYLMKPITSHVSSGEIFFIAYNKLRTWSCQQLESFLANPTATYDTVKLYCQQISKLSQQRFVELSTDPFYTSTSLNIPRTLQNLLYEWRLTRHKLVSFCRYIPIDWFNDDGLPCIELRTVDSLIARFHSEFPVPAQVLPRLILKSFFLSWGCAIVVRGYINACSFSSLQTNRQSELSYIRTNPGIIETSTLNSLITNFDHGGRLCLSLIGCAYQQIQALAEKDSTDDDD